MTCRISALFVRKQYALYGIMLLLLICGKVNAQTVKAVINPTGGTSAATDLKIEVLSDGGIKVTRKGLLESYIRTDSSQGMRSYFDFRNTDYLTGASLKSPSVCYISPVAGSGTTADPYTVQIVGTILDKYKNYPTGQTGTVTTIISYVQGNNYFFLDYILHLPSTSYKTSALFYLSEQAVMGMIPGGNPDDASTCAYGFVNADSTTVGIYRDASCSSTPDAPRSHVYRTAKRLSSFEVSVPGHRFYINDDGNFPYNTVANGIDGNARSMGIMRHMGGMFEDLVAPAPYNFKTFRVLSGYGTSMTEFDNIAAVNDSIPVAGFAPVTVAFSSATLSGNEGSAADGEKPASGLTLNVSGGKLNAPVYVLLEYDPTYPYYSHPAVEGTDFKLPQTAVLIPAGDYSGSGKTVAIPNLHVIGNDQLQYSRSLRLKLISTCTSLMSISGISECDYTIVDDEARSLVMVTDSASLYEGNFTKARINLASGITCPEDIVLTFSRLATSTAGDTDYIVPATVTIPANTLTTGDFIVTAKTDKCLENTEKLTLKFLGTMLGIPVTGQKDINIMDSTYLNPNYSKILVDCVSPSSTLPIPEGYGGYLSMHLPPGVTTEVPIALTPQADDSTAWVDLDYTLDTYSGINYSIPAGSTSSLIRFSTAADALLEGPVDEGIKLTVIGVDNVGGGRVYRFWGPALSIRDMDYDPNMKVVVTATPNPITEGDAGTTVNVALPNGIKTNYAISVAISRGLSSKATSADLVSALPASVNIAKNAKSVNFPSKVQAKSDNILETDESLWIVASPTGFAKDSGLVTIKDATGDVAGNKNVKVELLTTTLKEGTSSAIKISLNTTGVVAEEPINITLSRDAASVAAATDYAAGPTITLPAGNNSYTINNAFTAVTDNILEGDEAFTLNSSSTTITGLSINSISGVIQDATGDNAANKQITVVPSHTQMDEGGTGYSFSFNLPAGITTEVPIVITPDVIAGSTASAADFTLETSPLTLSSGNSVSSNVTITEDNILEGDENLILGGTATSAVLTGLQVNPGSVIIKDKVVIPELEVTTDRTDITEGGTGAYITISLPGGIVPSTPVNVTLSRGNSSQATAGFSGLPQTVSLSGNSVTIPVPVSALIDGILDDNETLVIVAQAPGYTGDSLTLNMLDATGSDPANRKITFTPEPASQGTHVMEGNNITVRASFPAGIRPFSTVTVSASASVLSQATTADYSGLPALVAINPATGYGDFTISALTDNIVESSELLRITGTSDMASATVDSLDLFIDDATTGGSIQMVYDSSAVYKTRFRMVTIGFSNPSLIAATPISLDISVDPSSTADLTNYSGIPATVTIPKDSNHITLWLKIGNNYKIEGPTVLQFNASATGYTVDAVAPLTVLDLTGAAVTVERVKDAAEPSTDGAFKIKLPAVSTSDVVVTYNTIYSSTNIQALAKTAVVPAGATELTVPVLIKDDQILQGDLLLSIVLNKAVAINGGSPINLNVNVSSAIINIGDDESATTGPKAEARKILIEKTSDAAQPSTAGGFKVRFNDSTLIATKDVTVSYDVAGTAIPGTEYTALSGTVVIPAGKSSALIAVTPAGLLTAGADKTVEPTLTDANSILAVAKWEFVDLAKTAQVIIYNSNIDTPTVNLFAATSSITEGDEIEFVVRTSKAISKDLPVTITVTNDIYRTLTLSGGTVSGNQLVLTMPAGLRERSFKARVNDNDISDDDGWIQASVMPYNNLSTNPPYIVGIAAELKNTVTDNDSLKLTYIANRYAVQVAFDTMGVPLPFKLRMNRPSSRLVTVYYEFYTPAAGELPKGTMAAVGGKDYDNTITPLLILPGQTDAEIPVLVNSVETERMFGMRLLRATVSSNQHVPAIDSIMTANGVIEICMDCDVDGDGVPDYVERFITDGRWENNNNGRVRVHPALSPNNDGLGNEVMQIENIDKYPQNEVTVFNRWGGTVFTTKGYNNVSNNFNGKSNVGAGKGQDVPDGSYFFIIHTTDPSGKKERSTGFIVIKR
ncbi:gliding motility-associated C-terminal domain-containing protein [Chitinophaga tropicalis]|nr:gliding motility-associated C-terminal domain-containing protein [Chitinophaga tropicalis]